MVVYNAESVTLSYYIEPRSCNKTLDVTFGKNGISCNLQNQGLSDFSCSTKTTASGRYEALFRSNDRSQLSQADFGSALKEFLIELIIYAVVFTVCFGPIYLCLRCSGIESDPEMLLNVSERATRLAIRTARI
ncbi:hypothetical protein GEMRC1_000920 [Eukaryota sp. GEM-RC1]